MGGHVNSLRYLLLLILVLLFSWPVITQANMSPWMMWVYPFFIWFLVIIIAIFFGDKEQQDE